MEIKQLGRFEIIDEIGAGGMGLVYKGRDPAINRLVALKVIRPQFGAGNEARHEENTKRFHVEAQAAGQLSHPNIVTIYDVGNKETPEGSLVYIAMEFLDGKGLDWHIRERTFKTIESKIEIVKQIAEGLTYAHDKGVIHRDVKPANIIIVSGKTAKITDFGLARLSDSSLTLSGTILGTPNYISPEQVEGKGVDARSDLFSLTVLFYEFLINMKPFAADSLSSVIYKVVHEQAQPPSTVDPTIPKTVDAFIKRGLAKNRDQRFQNGQEFIEALDSLQKKETREIDILGDTTAILRKDVVEKVTADKTAQDEAEEKPSKSGAKTIPLILVAFLVLAGLFGYSIFHDSKKRPAEKPVPIEKAVPVMKKEVQKEIIPPADPPAEPATTEDPPPLEAKETTPIEVVTKKEKPSAPPVVVETKLEQVAKPEHVAKPAHKHKRHKTVYNKDALRILVPKESLVIVDGRKFSKTRIDIPTLSPGSHLIYVQIKGRKPYSERFIHKKGDKKIVDLR